MAVDDVVAWVEEDTQALSKRSFPAITDTVRGVVVDPSCTHKSSTETAASSRRAQEPTWSSLQVSRFRKQMF